MKHAAVPALALVSAMAFAVGWTQNNQSDWLKGIIYAGSGKIQLTDATGNLAPQGSIAASGNLAVGGTLAVTGATTLRSTLNVTGNAGLGGTLAVTGNTTLTGTLAVTGATTLRSTLNVAGAVTAPTGTFTGDVSVTGNESVTGTLAVTGAATFRNASWSWTSIADTVTASTTSAQGLVAASGLMTTMVVEVTTSGTAGDSVTLPPAAAGLTVIVANHAAANAIDVFPNASDQINNVSVNGAISLAAGEGMFCIAATAIRWICVIGSAT